MFDFLKSLHSKRKDDIPDFIKSTNQIPCDIWAKSFWEGVRKTSKGSASGITGWNFKHIKAVYPDDDTDINFLYPIASQFYKGNDWKFEH